MNTKHIIEMMKGATISEREMKEILEFMLVRMGKNNPWEVLEPFFKLLKNK